MTRRSSTAQAPAPRAVAPGLIATGSLDLGATPRTCVEPTVLAGPSISEPLPLPIPPGPAATTPRLLDGPASLLFSLCIAAVLAPRWHRVDLVFEEWWYGAPKGDHCRCLFYDPRLERHFAGTGPNVTAALAACVDDYRYRGLLALLTLGGLRHRAARTA